MQSKNSYSHSDTEWQVTSHDEAYTKTWLLSSAGKGVSGEEVPEERGVSTAVPLEWE